MKCLPSMIIISLIIVMGGCGGGGGGGSDSGLNGTDAANVSVDPSSNLAKKTLVYSRSPVLNQELQLTVEDNEAAESTGYNWEVISSPDGSNLTLTESVAGNEVSLTPDVAGPYKIKVTPSDSDAIETEFTITQTWFVDPAKLRAYDDTKPLSQQSGIVENQAWVYSETLSQPQIQSVVAEYSSFTVVGYDLIRGLLIEFDEGSSQSQSNLNALKNRAGIDAVDLRVFEGVDAIKQPLRAADDGSAFNDGGDNWHLEYIGIESAWDISIGNRNFYIGIGDAVDTFHTEHEDLKGRFKEATRATDLSDPLSWHGTGVAGAIAAISNNRKGMSGINWLNQLVAGRGGFAGLNNIAAKDKVLIANLSVSIAGYVPETFDPTDSNNASSRQEEAFLRTRDHRKILNAYADKLFVFAGGNGIGNGSGNNNGVFGVDGKFDNPALHYIEENGEFVLAKKSNALLVAALVDDNKLAYNSNYGEAVDIAAPSNFKGTKSDSIIPFAVFDDYYESNEYGENTYNVAFGGTSSAAPVVTGVASLILATDSELTPENIKSILINSATSSATQRYTSFQNNVSNVEGLSYSIPILNAASALAMTKEIKEGRSVKATHVFPDPFTPTVEIDVLPGNESLETRQWSYEASARNNGATGSYEQFWEGNVAGFNTLLIQNLDSEKTHYKIDISNALLLHNASKVSFVTDLVYEFVVPVVTITTRENTRINVPNANVSISAEDGSFSAVSGMTDNSGRVNLYLAPGKYTVNASADNYDNQKSTLEIVPNQDAFNFSINMTRSHDNSGEENYTGLEPNTALTESETFTVPATENTPELDVVSESGFQGDIDHQLELVSGITTIQAVDIQRDIGISVVCSNEDSQPVSLSEADFSAAEITDSFYENGEKVVTCQSTFSPIVPIALTNFNISEVLQDWGGEPISSDCPIEYDVNTPSMPESSSLCSSIVVTNYLITDNTGKQHKISQRQTTQVINN